MNTKIKAFLNQNIDEKYKYFSSSLIPNINNILGVRLPILRKLAKNITKNHDEAIEFLDSNYNIFEETMLQGMVIGYLKVELKEKFGFIKQFMPKIDNWSICDSFCVGLKVEESEKKLWWVFLQPYFLSKKEYFIRFALVMSLNYFIDDNYINKIFEKLKNIKSDKKYVIMAEGWLLSFCYKKYPNLTKDFLRKNFISENVKKSAIRKIRELK